MHMEKAQDQAVLEEFLAEAKLCGSQETPWCAIAGAFWKSVS